MPLTETFNLTPLQPYYYVNNTQRAYLYIYGGYISYYGMTRFDYQYTNDRILFLSSFAGDRTLDYSQWSNLIHVPHIELYYDLSSLGTKKELALVFSFTASSDSSLFISTLGSSSPLAEETLTVGDNQFLIEVETLDPLSLHFIHVNKEGSPWGGSWFFQGISGYVI